MKLEIKHIIPYLPYQLKFLYHGNIYKMRWINRFGDIDYNSQNDFIDPFPPNIFNKELDFVKLIFRPLSDLTKEIEVNGEKFVPSKKLETKCIMTEFDLEEWIETIMESMPLSDWNLLFEWHFDVFGLIEKGLAIDINTL